MTEELKTLIELQQIDSQIISLKHTLDTIPSELKKIDGMINKFDKEFENEKKKLQDLEKKRKEKERQIEDLHEKIKKLKEKTSQIKTNKEYQALLLEISLIEDSIKKEEDNLLLMFYEIDENIKILEKSRKEWESKKNEILQLRKDIESDAEKINNEIENLKEKRKNIVSQLPSELYEEYKELMKKHKGLAVAEVIDEICQGCFLHIPPQLYVEIKLNQTIKYCPQCGRILYYKSKDKKEEQKVSSE
ncbi:MAG: C4-type zinc ribbon domain-containing protein [Thermodesulfovibrio sp.]|nr:C4-type zinc ribbon domain-containing protein [Thermodesulfovibrio sp.]